MSNLLYQVYLGLSLTWTFNMPPTLFPLGVGADVSLGLAGSEDGRATIMMPHPERAVSAQHGGTDGQEAHGTDRHNAQARQHYRPREGEIYRPEPSERGVADCGRRLLHIGVDAAQRIRD